MEELLVLDGIIVLVEDVRPIYNPSGRVDSNLIEAMHLVGFIIYYCRLMDVECVIRQPQQRKAMLDAIRRRIVGVRPSPAAPHFLDAEAHAISFLVDATDEGRQALIASLEGDTP